MLLRNLDFIEPALIDSIDLGRDQKMSEKDHTVLATYSVRDNSTNMVLLSFTRSLYLYIKNGM